jgi:multiple sugar transport system permease protein
MPAFVLLLVMIIYPFIYCLWNSFHIWYLGRPEIKPFVGFYNYQLLLLRDPVFQISLVNTFIIAVIAIPSELLIALLLAYLLFSEKPKGEKIFRSIFILPMLLAPVIVGVLWRFLYHPNVGLINYFLETFLGIGHVNFLGDPKLALLSVTFVEIWQWTSFMFLIIYAGLTFLPQSIIDAALIDGCSGFSMFRYIVLPLAKSIILLAIIFRTIDIVKIFDAIWVLTRGGPGSATDVLTLYAFRQGLVYFQIGTASALSFIISIIVTILVTIYFKIWGERLA